MRPVWLLVLAAAGCRDLLGLETAHVVEDAGEDAAACTTGWQPRGFDPCALGTPQPALALAAGGYVYTAGSDGGALVDGTGSRLRVSTVTVTQADQSIVDVLAVESLTIAAGATLRVTGPRALLVVAWSTIVIDGAIDAGSHLGVTDAAAHVAETVTFGAGADQACTAFAGKPGGNAAAAGGSGGGGGGGLQGTGGLGGTGGTASAPGGDGGPSAAATVIRGGCPGGASGTAGAIAAPPASAASRALGGAGGGALRLAAQRSIAITGSISANGAGGAGAPTTSACGGGGGGAGGYVGLDAPVVMVSGALTANGGGGGGGGPASGAGNDGLDGATTGTAAPGGAIATGSCGQPGGQGSVQTTLGGANAAGGDACGGGGGGGAAGFIVVASPAYTAATDAVISPPVLLQ